MTTINMTSYEKPLLHVDPSINHRKISTLKTMTRISTCIVGICGTAFSIINMNLEHPNLIASHSITFIANISLILVGGGGFLLHRRQATIEMDENKKFIKDLNEIYQKTKIHTEAFEGFQKQPEDILKNISKYIDQTHEQIATLKADHALLQSFQRAQVSQNNLSGQAIHQFIENLRAPLNETLSNSDASPTRGHSNSRATTPNSHNISINIDSNPSP